MFRTRDNRDRAPDPGSRRVLVIVDIRTFLEMDEIHQSCGGGVEPPKQQFTIVMELLAAHGLNASRMMQSRVLCHPYVILTSYGASLLNVINDTS